MSTAALRHELTIALAADAVVTSEHVYAWGDRAWCTRFPLGSKYCDQVITKLGAQAYRPVPSGVIEMMETAEREPRHVRRLHRRSLELGVLNPSVEAIRIADVLVPRRYVGVAVAHAQRADDAWLRVWSAGITAIDCAVVRGADWIVVYAPLGFDDSETDEQVGT